ERWHLAETLSPLRPTGKSPLLGGSGDARFVVGLDLLDALVLELVGVEVALPRVLAVAAPRLAARGHRALVLRAAVEARLAHFTVAAPRAPARRERRVDAVARVAAALDRLLAAPERLAAGVLGARRLVAAVAAARGALVDLERAALGIRRIAELLAVADAAGDLLFAARAVARAVAAALIVLMEARRLAGLAQLAAHQLVGARRRGGPGHRDDQHH